MTVAPNDAEQRVGGAAESRAAGSRESGLTESALVAVSGKGGVGKTTVSAAVARLMSRAGYKTLVAEVNTQGRMPELFGVRAAHTSERPGALTRIDDLLYHINLTPEASLHEFALLVLRWETLYNLVLQNRFVKSFLEAAPALASATMLGKLYYHGTPNGLFAGAELFDRIVIDAPATGHAISFFKTPRALATMVPPGPMRTNSEVVGRFIATNSAFMLVTLPEEMPVTESIELATAVESELSFTRGYLVANQCMPPVAGLDGLSDEVAMALHQHAAKLEGVDDRKLAHMTVDRLEAIGREGRQVARLQAGVAWPLARVERLAAPTFGLREIDEVASRLAAVFDAEHAQEGGRS